MENYNEVFRTKTKELSILIIQETANLKYSDALGIIRKQLIRSATSFTANYRAVGRSRSEKEKYAKLCIVVEEADETLFGIELLDELKLIPHQKIIPIKEKASEIIKVMASYRKKLSLQ